MPALKITKYIYAGINLHFTEIFLAEFKTVVNFQTFLIALWQKNHLIID